MNIVELIGYLASALVLATFCMRNMVALRCMAIASNLAFISYGALADLGPVLVLHLLLLPVNVLQLMVWRASTATAAVRRAMTGHEQLPPARLRRSAARAPSGRFVMKRQTTSVRGPSGKQQKPRFLEGNVRTWPDKEPSRRNRRALELKNGAMRWTS